LSGSGDVGVLDDVDGVDIFEYVGPSKVSEHMGLSEAAGLSENIGVFLLAEVRKAF
jgi:hypothetical protein